jgi:hypothetical protein
MSKETLSEQILRIYCEGIDDKIERCTCGAWYYIGKTCEFCQKWNDRG